MPAHDWTRVKPGIFHHFHQQWIGDIARTLNAGLLPSSYYALEEQRTAGVEPDVLTLEAHGNGDNHSAAESVTADGGILLLAPPQTKVVAETDMEFYRRKQSSVVVRHASDDRVVALIEVVSPGNKIGRAAVRAFVEKAAELLEKRIHLVVLDVLPPGTLDPQGIHGLIWEEVSGEEYTAPPDKPLTLAAYESSLRLRAFVEPFSVGDRLSDVPLFLEPGGYVLVPSEATYQRAFAAVPARWRRVLE
jgi:hypothetical protein